MKVITQKKINECYIACCCEILNYFHIPFTYKSVKNKLKQNDLFHIRLFLENFGLKCSSFQFENKRKLSKYKFKIGIAQYKTIIGFHFVCFYRKNNLLYIKKPNRLRPHKLKFSKLNKWTGIIMFIDK